MGVIIEDWTVLVTEYVVNPQPFNLIEVRVYGGLIDSRVPDLIIRLKEPRLEADERVLLFLGKSERTPTAPSIGLGEHQFTMLGVGYWGKLVLQDGKARNEYAAFFNPRDEQPWEPLDDIIAAIRALER